MCLCEIMHASVCVMTVCVSVREIEGGDSPHCLRHQPDSSRAGLKAGYRGSGVLNGRLVEQMPDTFMRTSGRR